MVVAFAIMAVSLAAAAHTVVPGMWLCMALAAWLWQCLYMPRRAAALAASAALALAWFVSRAGALAAVPLHAALEGVQVDVTGRVVGAVQGDALALRFTFAPADPSLPERIRVAWPAPVLSPPRGGECWRLRLHVRSLRVRRNPGAFDRAAWQLRRGVGASARVRHHRSNARCRDEQRPAAGAALRAGIGAAIDDAVARADVAAVIKALTIGERVALEPGTRELLARTGTAHLVAISGLHVGMVAALGYLLGGRVRMRHAVFLRAVPVALAVAFAAAYAALSGFALPARRALIMIAFVGLLGLARRPVAASRLVALAAIAVTLVTPAYVVDASFVFSFLAVTTLALYRDCAGWRRSQPGKLVAVVQAQAVLGLALLPATVHAFGFASALSLPANLVAVPLFSLVVVPLSLAGAALAAVSEPLAAIPWWCAARLVGATLDGLQWLTSRAQWAVVPARLPGAASAIAATLVLGWCTLARSAPGRLLAAAAGLATLSAAPSRPMTDCARATLLAVGHGTAAVVRTGRHTLVYDTGPAWPGGNAVAETSLLPYLHRAGDARVHLAVLSHADSDHTGGAAALQADTAVSGWLVGQGVTAPREGAVACRAGQRWHEAGVTFEVVWPVPGRIAAASDNDGSCVLRVTAGTSRLLLAGDIEARAEREIVSLRGARADVVTVPHHGSATSSTDAFVGASAARIAVVSADPGGRWALPAPAIADRWQAAGARLTATAPGAVGIGLCAGRGAGLQDPDPWAESSGALW